MLKNARIKIVVLILTFLLVGNILVYQDVNAVEMSRIVRVTGPTEMETAIEIAMKLNPGIAPAVILANPISYHEALAAIPLAQQKKAPILWVGPTPEESEAIFNHINDHCDKNGLIYILGDYDIIPKSFEMALNELGYKQEQIVRLGGANYYETAAIIATMVEYKGSPIILSSGKDNSQITGIAAMAAAQESPILFLSPDGNLPNVVSDYLSSLSARDKITIQIIGDIKTFPNSVVSELKSKVKNWNQVGVNRISGNDPYDLMTKIYGQAWFAEVIESEDKIPISSITLTTAEHYAIGIAGAVLAAQNKEPLVFIDEQGPNSSTNFLKDIYHWNGGIDISFRQVTVLGDLSPELVAEADSLFTLGKSLESNAQVWTYAELYSSIEPNYGVIGEDDSIIISDNNLILFKKASC